MAISVGIQGASGYVGGELLRILALHPHVEIRFVTSERFAGQSMGRVFPHLAKLSHLVCRPLDDLSEVAACDVVFCALPHGASMKVIPEILQRGKRVIDLSADYRLNNEAVYQEWYGEKHLTPSLLAEAVYGLPEINRSAIPSARLLANPGCYPTSAVLALAPLVAEHLIDLELIVIDSKSGVSGAGRGLAQGKLYAELSEGFRPYGIASHRHTPEIEQVLSGLAGESLRVRFTPHLLPQSRGILSTCHVRPKAARTEVQWRELFRSFYKDAPFVYVLEVGELPATNHVRASNYCHLAVVPDARTGWLTVLSTIDNLVKGAAGQAVHNMNLMFALDETVGISHLPVFP